VQYPPAPGSGIRAAGAQVGRVGIDGCQKYRSGGMRAWSGALPNRNPVVLLPSFRTAAEVEPMQFEVKVK
jgi:hypothetical protein